MFPFALNSSPDHFSAELRIKLTAIELLLFLCCLRFSVSDVPGLKKVLPTSHKALQGVAVTFNLSLSPVSRGVFWITAVLSILFALSLTHTQLKKSNWNYGISPRGICAVWTEVCLEIKFLLINLINVIQSLETSVNSAGVHLLFMAHHRNRDLG